MVNNFHIVLSLGMLCLISQAVNAQEMKPEETEDWSRIPELITFTGKDKVPSDAIVLFSKRNLDQWVGKDGGPAQWKIKGKTFVVAPGAGSIQTKEAFGDCQLHIEWKTPKEDVKAGKNGQKCGNSGVLLMGKYEIQVLNSYDSETYPNGQAASVYKQHIPLVNASLPAEKWQSYDIIFTAPVFEGEGEDAKLASPAYFTVFHNGVLVQHHVEVKGPTKWIGYPEYEWHEAELPLSLQDHKNLVAYRNIWIRKL